MEANHVYRTFLPVVIKWYAFYKENIDFPQVQTHFKAFKIAALVDEKHKGTLYRHIMIFFLYCVVALYELEKKERRCNILYFLKLAHLQCCIGSRPTWLSYVLFTKTVKYRRVGVHFIFIFPKC